MALAQQFDSLELKTLALPYAPNRGFLSEQPCLQDGYDAYVTWGGTLNKRPGTLAYGPASAITKRIDRLWFYETLETTPTVYMVGSFKNGTVWELQYAKVSTGTPAWTLATERRGCNHSKFPHEGLVKRGKLYLKGFPLIADDASLLGSVVLDASTGSMVTHDWGALGPTSPSALTNPAGWTASAHAVSVLTSWGYVYTIVMASGQETNHSPLQTNPDAAPSFTGAFTNKLPAMSVTGPADTTEYPFLNIYRTTDGGGTFFFLKQITNTGGAITFEDKYLASGSGNADPLPDSLLDTAQVSPTTQSNSPPPTVPVGLVTGTDAIQRCTRIVEYANRIWYGIAQYLFYSALEELNAGVPEESWPSGISLPNFFELPRIITQLINTPDGILSITTKETIRINGTTKSTFNPRPFLGNIGGAPNYQNRASVEAGENVAWLTQDFRLAVVHGDQYAILTNPLGLQFQTDANNGNQFDIKFWAQADKEWLLVASIDQTTPANTKVWVYDLFRARVSSDDFWYVPFSVKCSALAVGQQSVTDSENKLIFSLWDNTNTKLGKLDASAIPVATDINPSSGTPSNFGMSFTTWLAGVPPGDHENELRKPFDNPVWSALQYERTNFGVAGEVDPQAYIYVDDFFSSPITLQYPGDQPARREQSKGFLTIIQNDIREVCKHGAIQLTSAASAFPVELHQLAWIWEPDGGA